MTATPGFGSSALSICHFALRSCLNFKHGRGLTLRRGGEKKTKKQNNNQNLWYHHELQKCDCNLKNVWKRKERRGCAEVNELQSKNVFEKGETLPSLEGKNFIGEGFFSRRNGGHYGGGYYTEVGWSRSSPSRGEGSPRGASEIFKST